MAPKTPRKTETSTKVDTKSADKPTDGLNNATRKAHLNINVENTKKWCKGFFKAMDFQPLPDDYYKDIKENQAAHANVDLNRVLPKYKGYHIGLTAVNEYAIDFLVTCCLNNCPKENNLYSVTRASLTYAIQLDPLAKQVFYRYLQTYTETDNYTTSYFATQKELSKYVDMLKKPNVFVRNDGYNLMCYLLKQLSADLTKSAFYATRYRNPKSAGNLANRDLLVAARILLPDQFYYECERCVSATNTEESDENDAGETNEPEKPAAAPEKPKKQEVTSTKVSGKKVTKPKEQVATPPPADSDSDDDNADDNADASDDDDSDNKQAEPEPEPVKPGKKNKAK